MPFPRHFLKHFIEEMQGKFLYSKLKDTMKHISPNQIDTFTEEIIDLDTAAAHIARISKTKRNRRVLLRWANRGLAGVKLPTILIGGQIYTSKEKLNWFLNESAKAKRLQRSDETKTGFRKRRHEQPKDPDLEEEARALGI
jgi:hypothetical protein